MTDIERIELACRRAATIVDKKNIHTMGDVLRFLADELARLPKEKEKS